MTPLCPVGPFTCPNYRDLLLGPEAVFSLPICFAPTEEKYYEEHLEITSAKTITSVKISGQGVVPSVTVNPQYVVYRLEADAGGFTVLALEVSIWAVLKAQTIKDFRWSIVVLPVCH